MVTNYDSKINKLISLPGRVYELRTTLGQMIRACAETQSNLEVKYGSDTGNPTFSHYDFVDNVYSAIVNQLPLECNMDGVTFNFKFPEEVRILGETRIREIIGEYYPEDE